MTPDITRKTIARTVDAMLRADITGGSLNQKGEEGLLRETMEIHYVQLCAIVSAIAPELPVYEVRIESSEEIRMVKITSPQELEGIITG